MSHETESHLLSLSEAIAGLSATTQQLHRLGIEFLPVGDPEAGKVWLHEHTQRPELISPDSRTMASGPRPSSSATGAPPSVESASPNREPSSLGSELLESSNPYPEALPLADRQRRMCRLAAEVAGCTACPGLVQSRTQTVFGEGDLAAKVCFFGEAPGADEDRQGRPFVGRSGELLTRMIQACRLAREEVYILNTVKCRPPHNRNPDRDELGNCRHFFETQLELIHPEYIVCLGAVAAHTLLNSKASVGQLRGRFHVYRNSKVVVTYHPSYLLREPKAKRFAWDDLRMLMADQGVIL